MKLIKVLLILAPAWLPTLHAQDLTLEECQSKARANYPLIQQMELIQRSGEYSVSNAGMAYLPQFQLYGQATYQNDVVNIPTGVPGVTRPVLDKDQYKLYAEMNQLLYDGGVTRRQKQLQNAQATLDKSKLEADLFALNDRVNQLFFGILILNEQLKQNALLQSDISAALKQVQAQVANGAALKSNEDVLKADLLKAKQRELDIIYSYSAFLNMMSAFVGKPLNDAVKFVKPALITAAGPISRPELKVFESQQFIIKTQNSMLNARSMPKLNAFLQAGYGYPGFDFFKDDFAWFYIGGIRLNWNFSSYYTLGKERKILANNQRMVDVQQQTFLFNTNFALSQQKAEESKYLEMMKSDDEIVQLRKQIKERAAIQLQNGTIQAADYLREVNAEDLARQNKFLHEIQFLQSQYNQKNTRGN